MSQEEFNKIYESYKDDVFRVAFFYTGSKEDAEDVAIDVFGDLYSKPPTSQGNLLSYLLCGAMRKSKDLMRKERRHAHAEFDESASKDKSGSERQADLGCVASLPGKLKAAIVLFYLEGKSVSEGAEILSISEASFRKRLERGRKRLKERMENDDGE